MSPIESIGIPSELCICGHLLEDHDDSPGCTIIEYSEQCPCKWFTPNDNADVEEEQDEDFGE
jgi:hypothetical protein